MLSLQQTSLHKKHVVLVGVGALGSVAAELLTRAGIGRLTLIDRDCVEASNLRRQNLYTENDIGEAKVTAAGEHLKKINPSVTFIAHATDLVAANSNLLQSDLIMDGTDNFQTRFLINEYSQKQNIPWIYSAAIRDEGFVHAYLPGVGSCFACVFGEAYGLESCATAGILPQTSRMVAEVQAQEALKMLKGEKPAQELLHCNISKKTLEKFSLPQKKDCLVCQQKHYPFLSGKKELPLIRLCGNESYQLRAKNFDIVALEKRLQKLGDVKRFSTGLHFQGLTIFADGRILMKAKTTVEAKKKCTQYIGV